MSRSRLWLPIALLAASCATPSAGPPPASPAVAPKSASSLPAGQSASSPAPPPASGQAKPRAAAASTPAGWGPLPQLPQIGKPPPAPRPAPHIATVAQAEQAIARGFYDPARAFLDADHRGADRGGRELALAHLDLATGAYDDAASLAKEASRAASLRVAALTARGEALAHRGKLDDAEAAFRKVAGAPDAHRARVLLGRLLARRGHETEARTWFYKLIDAYNDETIKLDDAAGLTYVAMAARGLGAYQDANDAFQQATKADPARVETQLEWARLFLEKYDTGHAEESVKQALASNPNSPEAHALLARIRIAQSFDFQAADRELDRAQAVNPNLVSAYVIRAGMALRDEDWTHADAQLDKALAVDPNDLEALSVRAALRLVTGDRPGFQRAEKAVLDHDPTFSRMYTIIAEYAEFEHRYPAIVELARKAVKIDPDDGLAYATLGLNLLRTGDEKAGVAALRKSWQLDRFNVQVFNTLNLFDDVIPKQYVDFTSGPFVFRMERDEKPMLERYVPQLLERAYHSMVRRYGFTPKGPIRIELYGNPQDFAVRTTGLPNLGVQGVCFGRVITALSPKGGPFNWGQITWHELSHVFHLQLSHNRVPRWFTEGLAEYETMIARPEWKREMDEQLWLALDAGRLPPLALMNRAFTHAGSPQDMLTAYYAASQEVKYIVGRFGMPKVVAMLKAWGRGESTPDVVRDVLGVDIDALDKDFRAATRARLAKRANDFTVDFRRYDDLDALRTRAQQHPDDAGARAALAVGLAVAGDSDQAVEVAREVVARVPTQPVASFLLGRIALAHRRPAEAQKHLDQVLAGGHDGYEVRLLLARAAVARKDLAGARAQLEAATRIDADRPEAWMGLAAIAHRQHDGDLRLRALERLARIDEHDRDTIEALLPLLAKRKAWSDLVTFGEMGVLVDPHQPEVHRLYAEGLMHTGHPDRALFELDSTLIAKPEHPGPVQLARARALLALGRRSDAERAAHDAVTADPSLAGQAKALLAK